MGEVCVGERRVAKAGDVLPAGAPLELRGQDHPWVSRGGLKLAHGLEAFGLSPRGRVCLDVGASTGGFTDVLLHGGAARVHAVDVGHGQLAWGGGRAPRGRGGAGAGARPHAAIYQAIGRDDVAVEIITTGR